MTSRLTFITELESSLGDILELELLPHFQVLHEDLVKWLSQEQHLISACMELLDKDTLRELVGSLAYVREVEDLLLALLAVLEVLIKCREVPVVGAEPDEAGELVAVLRVLNSTKFEDVVVRRLNLLPSFLVATVFLSTRKLLEHLNDALGDDAAKLLEELGRLESLTGNVQRKILSIDNDLDP